jgi:hypothetical protein
VVRNTETDAFSTLVDNNIFLLENQCSWGLGFRMGICVASWEEVHGRDGKEGPIESVLDVACLGANGIVYRHKKHSTRLFSRYLQL